MGQGRFGSVADIRDMPTAALAWVGCPLLTQSRWGGWLPLPASKCHAVDAVMQPRAKEPSAMEITTIGLDLAKCVFQVHGVNGAGQVVVRKALRRSQVLRFFEQLPPCLVGLEACGTSHY